MGTSSNGWSALLPGRTLGSGEELRSRSGQYKIRMQGDGNLVAYDGDEQPYWSSYTQGRPGSVLTMQDDGNLVLHNLDGALGWHTATYGHPGAIFVVDDDGNMVVTGTDGEPLWSVWQNTYDRGSGLGQWIGRAESSLGGIVEILHDAAKVLRVALPAISAVLAATGVGLPFAAALAAAGAEIAAVDAAVSEIQDLVQQGEDGYHAAVAVLNDYVTPEQILQARDSLATDEDRAAFDLALQNAGQLASNSTAVESASAIIEPKPIDLRRFGRMGNVLTPPAPAPAPKLAINPGLLGRMGGAFAPKPAPVPSANILDVLAKAKGISKAAYVADVQARAAAAKPPPAKPAKPATAPSSSSSGAAIAGVAVVLALVLASRR